MTNQRYAGSITSGTNLTAAESAVIDAHIDAAVLALDSQARRLAVLRQMRDEISLLQRMVDAKPLEPLA